MMEPFGDPTQEHGASDADDAAQGAAFGGGFPFEAGERPNGAGLVEAREESESSMGDADTSATHEGDRRRQEIARDVVLELQALRGGLEELVQAYSARVTTQLANTARQLEEGVLGESERELPSSKKLNRLLKELRGTRLKPGKGRARDLKRMEKVAEALSDLSLED